MFELARLLLYVAEMADRPRYCLGYVLALGMLCACGGLDREGESGVNTAGTSASSEADSKGGTAGDPAAAGGTIAAAGAMSPGGGGQSEAASGGTSGNGGASHVGGQGGVQTGGAAACTFDMPQCPMPHAACAELGATQNCFEWQTCHSVPSKEICCNTGWERGLSCPDDGAGGAPADACGGCDTSQREICIFQNGGPGPAHFTCAVQEECRAAGLCACIIDQGPCEFSTTGALADYCVCNNGLK